MRPTANLTRACTSALLVACVLASVAAAPPSRTGAPRTSEIDLSSIDIENFGRINANYYRGAQPDDDDYAALAAIGVKTLIDLTSDDGRVNERALVESALMKYFRIPMTTHEGPTAAKVAEFLRIVTDPLSQPVYVHCVGGRHRTGVMTAVYRMTQDGWTADQAFQEMKQYKFGASFLHPQLKAFVYAFRPDAARAALVPAVSLESTGQN